MPPSSIIETIREAGVVGAGGAGFPTHVKWKAQVDTVLANGAECEPLLHKDGGVMERCTAEVVEGLLLCAQATGAQRLCVGLKAKKKAAIAALEQVAPAKGVEISVLGDYYPTGDEYELVHAVTGRLIPPAGLPLQVGVVVNNVESLYNAARAMQGHPVTQKFLTVAGAVAQPATYRVPLGISFRDLIEAAGGPTVERWAIMVSGIMMGKLSHDPDQPVTKTTAGLIILPADHYVISRRERPLSAMNRIGKSACDQCSYCTEFCPRYLLGYDVQPHKVMRSLGFTMMNEDFWSKWGDLCCACGVCTLYACPEDLYPKEACDQAKARMRQMGIRWLGPERELKPHPMADSRRLPLKKLEEKLDLLRYDHPAPFVEREWAPRQVRLLLQQHVGKPAVPVVKVGDRVQVGQKIADLPADQLGVPVHASIEGRVASVSEQEIILEG